jgi:hypothetical protein
MSGIAAIIFLILALFLFFVPAIIALDRKLLNFGSISIACMGARRNCANQIHACLSSKIASA